MTKIEIYWQGEVFEYDDFGNPIGDYFIDGKTINGSWALMGEASFILYGIGFGIGKGQLYAKQSDGRWMKVGGKS